MSAASTDSHAPEFAELTLFTHNVRILFVDDPRILRARLTMAKKQFQAWLERYITREVIKMLVLGFLGALLLAGIIMLMPAEVLSFMWLITCLLVATLPFTLYGMLVGTLAMTVFQWLQMFLLWNIARHQHKVGLFIKDKFNTVKNVFTRKEGN